MDTHLHCTTDFYLVRLGHWGKEGASPVKPVFMAKESIEAVQLSRIGRHMLI